MSVGTVLFDTFYGARVRFTRIISVNFQNSRFVHVGNGAYGHKIGALLVLLMPFMGFLPGNTKEEFHTDNEEEKIQMECDWNIKEKRAQILYAICGDLVGVMAMILLCIVG